MPVDDELHGGRRLGERAGSCLPLAEHWNGSAWHSEAVTAPATSGELAAVSCYSTSACEAVGSNLDLNPLPEDMSYFWNGTHWTAGFPQGSARPRQSLGDALTGVSCVLTRCQAVGYEDLDGFSDLAQATLINTTGSHLQTTPEPPGATSSSYTGVSCSSAARCIAVGYYGTASSSYALTEAWDGASWRTNPSGDEKGAQWTAVSCTGTDACTGVGETFRNTGEEVTFVERWNGHRWTAETTPTISGQEQDHFQGVSCTSATHCVAVGDYQNKAGTVLPLAENWNGKAWTVQAQG